MLRNVKNLLTQTGLPDDIQLSNALNYLSRIIHAQSSTLGFQDSFLMVGLIFSLALIPTALMARTR